MQKNIFEVTNMKIYSNVKFKYRPNISFRSLFLGKLHSGSEENSTLKKKCMKNENENEK